MGYQVVGTGDDTLMSISMFRSAEEAQRSTEIAAQGPPKTSRSSAWSAWARSPAR